MSAQTSRSLEGGIDEALASGDLGRAADLARRYREEGGQPLRTGYLSAQVALAAGHLEEALGHLGPLLPPRDVPPELACRLWLLAAEALARLGRHALARGHLIHAAVPAGPLDLPTLRLREIRIRLLMGETPRPDVVARCLDALDAANRALLLSELGRSHDARGELPEAEGCWRRTLTLAAPLGRDAIHADALLQLGRLAHLRGHLQEALDRYEAAIEHSPAEAQRAEAGLRRVLVLLDLNQREVARRSAPTPPADAEELRPLAAQVAALLAGETPPDEAESSSPVRRARRALALGLAAIDAGNVRDGRDWLEEASRLAEEEGLPEVRWRALEGRGRVAAEAGDEEAARALFEDAIRVSEAQAATLRHRADAAAHGVRRADLLGRLLSGACRRGDAAAAFRLLELQRGRLLVEMWRATGAIDPPPADDSLEGGRRLDAWLRDRSRVADSALPTIPDLNEVRQVLAPGQVFVAPALAAGGGGGGVGRSPHPRGNEAWLLACWPGGTRLLPLAHLDGIDALRHAIDSQLRRYACGLGVQRGPLDDALSALGDGPLGAALWRVRDEAAARQIVWAPDGALHGVPLAALRRGGKYLVESASVVNTFGGSLLVHHARHPAPWRWGRAAVVTESAGVLPDAAREGDGVAASFWLSTRLHGKDATRAALQKVLPTAKCVHLACHSYFDAGDPLAARIGLPSGESWGVADWLGGGVAGLPLAVLSACRSAQAAPLHGREVFGLVAALLAGGARSAVAGLWPVADREAVPLMWAFHRHRITNAPGDALARAQREMLHLPPLFWAAFAFFGDPWVLPAPRGVWRWIAGWLRGRHARSFPLTTEPSHGP